MRIGKIDGNFVVNPPEEYAARRARARPDRRRHRGGDPDGRGRANEIPEAEILDALDIAHDAIKKLCAAQRDLAEKAGKEKLVFEAVRSTRR